MTKSATSFLFRSAASVSFATFLSRISGFIRDILLAQIVGAGAAADIFVIAFRLPNLFRRLFAEGAFNAAFVPLFSDRLQKDGAAAAAHFAGRIFMVLLVSVCVFTLLAEIFMPFLILALAQGFAGDTEKFALAVYYARISFPYLVFMSLLSLFAGMLNAVGRFWIVASAPILLNLVLIAALILVAINGGAPLDYLTWGISLAGLLQFAVVFLAAWRANLRIPFLRPQWNKEGSERRFFKLAVPGILAGGVGQINLLVGTSIATSQAGAAAWLYYADRLYQFPLALIGVALSIVLLPVLSRSVAMGDEAQARHRLDAALAGALALTLPAAAGLYVLAEPIVRILFERGAFLFADSRAVAQAVQIFCLGLPAFVVMRVLQSAFFARQDTRAPFIDGAWGVVVNIALALILFPRYGHIAIAWATVAAGGVSAVLMGYRLARRKIWVASWQLGRQLIAQLAATLLMAGAVAVLAAYLLPANALTLAFADGHQLAMIGRLTLVILGGMGVFALLVLALGGIQIKAQQNK